MSVILGLDIGNYTVKAVKIKKGLRNVKILSINEYRIEGKDKIEVLKEVATKEGEGVDFVLSRLPGDKFSLRKLKLPKGAFKNIEQILTYQLEGVIPYDPKECILSWQYVGKPTKKEELELFVSASLISTVESELNLLKEVGLEPSSILAGALVLGELTPYIPELKLSPKTVAILDIGHNRSDFCVIGEEGEPIFARTLNKGVSIIDKLLLKKFHYLDKEKVETYKSQYLSLTQHKTDEYFTKVVLEALSHFTKELKQTIVAYERECKNPINKLYITGGGAKIKGIKEYLEDELKIEVELLKPNIEVDPFIKEELSYYGMALGIALSSANKKKRIDFRKGELAFVKDVSKIRSYLFRALLYLTILYLGWLFSTLSNYYSLKKEIEWQKEQLEEITKYITGTPIKEFDRLSSLLKKGEKKKEEKEPIPEYDVFDLLEEMSKLIPQSINNEIERLEIRSGRIEIVGKVDSISDANEIVKSLSSWEQCFKTVQLSRTNEITREARTRYTIDIESKCP